MIKIIIGVIIALGGCAPSKGPGYNDCVLEVLRGYPLDGSFGYHWPKESAWEGTTQDIVYDGRTLCTGDPRKRSFCCGLTFEVFFRAWERYDASRKRPFRIKVLRAADLHELRLRWFGDSKQGERRRLVQHAIESMGLGRTVPPGEAKAGDFIQFWRHSGSGHSAIFINWVTDRGRLAGVTYWSTQGSTSGIGYKTEPIGGKDGVNPDELYLARLTPD